MSLAMVEMVSLRSFRLATTTGHIMHFVAGESKMVPQPAVQQAMAQGCVPKKDVQTLFEDTRSTRYQVNGELRQSVLFLAMEALSKENKSSNFDAAGMPRVDVVSSYVGFDVPPTECKKLYSTFVELSSAGEIAYHKDAKAVIDIVQAQDQRELMAQLPFTGLSEADVKGLSIRDKRQKMLESFPGLTVA